MGAPVVHFEIGCRDKSKTADFYSKLLGWKMQPFGDTAVMIDTGIGQPPAPGSMGINGHINQLGHPPHNYITVYAQVDDIPATLKKAESLGGQTIVPAMEVPGVGHFAWLKDIDGNAFGLWKPIKK